MTLPLGVKKPPLANISYNKIMELGMDNIIRIPSIKTDEVSVETNNRFLPGGKVIADEDAI